MSGREFEELRGQSDAAELGRVAAAFDVADAPGPRREFLARLRADIEREAASGRAAPARRWPSLRPTASVALAALLALAAAVAFPQAPATHVPAGRAILVASASGFVAYDPVTLQERARVSVPAPEPWATLAPDQHTLVFTFLHGPTHVMRILDIGDPFAFREVAGLADPRQFALSRDGARAYVRDGEAIKTVDVAAARVVAMLPTPGIENSPVYLAPDDRRLFQFVPHGQLVVFDMAEGREVQRVAVNLRDEEGLSASARVAFSPDGSRLYAVGSEGQSGGPIHVLVLDASSLETIAEKSLDPQSGPSLSRGSGPLAELAGALASLGFVAEAKEFGTVTQIALSPDGRTLYAARGPAGSGIVLVDTGRLEVIGRMESARDVYALQLTPDGSRLFALTGPTAALASSQLVALDARGYGVVATAPIRDTSADAAVLLYRP